MLNKHYVHQTYLQNVIVLLQLFYHWTGINTKYVACMILNHIKYHEYKFSHTACNNIHQGETITRDSYEAPNDLMQLFRNIK
jgi:hypothetical protein